MITPLFGFPIYKSTIDENKYDKSLILNSILKNYEIDNNRNNWYSGTYKKSYLHQSNSDEHNKNFYTVDYSSLLPLYKEKTIDFLNCLNFKNNISFEIKVINYTCITNNQFLQSHIHQDCDFTAVHYIKFDENQHYPTVYENKSFLTQYLNKLRPDFYKNLDEKNYLNSWCYENFSLPVKENDICFIPSFLNHFIPEQKETTEKRITIVADINIIKNE
jgi:hypothetical protein